jgi:hypothetical protein
LDQLDAMAQITRQNSMKYLIEPVHFIYADNHVSFYEFFYSIHAIFSISGVNIFIHEKTIILSSSHTSFAPMEGYFSVLPYKWKLIFNALLFFKIRHRNEIPRMLFINRTRWLTFSLPNVYY